MEDVIAAAAPALGVDGPVRRDAVVLALDEQRLIRRCVAGEHAAFEPLYRAHQRSVYGLIHRLVGSDELAADLTQDAFLRAYRSLGRFRPGAAFRPWLLRIARNAAIDHLRSGRSRFETAAIDAERVERDTPAEIASRRQRVRATEAALATIRPSYREALVLHVIMGLSYKDMSEVTGDSLASLKIRVVRARQALRAALGGEP